MIFPKVCTKKDNGGDIKMTEVLSQDEIDQLLNAINVSVSDSGDFKPPQDHRKIKIYDFKRPDRFSKGQIQTMSMIHEIFARHATLILTSRFKMPCHIRVASVDQLTYEEFMRSIPTPTTMAVIDLNGPMMNQAIMEIDPETSFVLIDRAFGGNERYIKLRHELTCLEWIVMTDVINRLLESMKEGWAQIIDLRLSPRINYTGTNPSYINIVPPAEMIALITLEANIGGVEGMINICYPYRCLEGVIGRLAVSRQWYRAYSLPSKNYKLIPHEIPVELVAEVFRRDYPIGDIWKWKNEEILLPLRHRAPNTCYLRIGAQRIWYCEILEDKGWFFKKIKLNGPVEFPAGSEGRMEIMSGANPVVAEALAGVNITISVEFGRTSKSIKDTLSLGEESILELDKLAGEEMDIRANGVLIAKGEAIVIDENFGVRITEIIKSIGPAPLGSGNA
jgi:flagellar motor switch protein FliM